MIFAPSMVALIREHRKVQVRFPVRRHPEFGFEMKCRFRAGDVYKVQTTRRWTVATLRVHRGLVELAQPTRARAVLAYLTEPLDAGLTSATIITTRLEVTVTDVRRERLGDIGKDDLRREGFRLRSAFEEHWRGRHRVFDPDQSVWVISFEAGDQRHKFDRDLFMKALPGRGGMDVDEHQDYTEKRHLALDAEAPVVSPAYLLRLGDEARRRDDVRERAVRAERPLTERVADIQRRALDGDQQAKRHLHVIAQRVQAAEAKAARESEAA